MSESNPARLGEQNSLWLFCDFVTDEAPSRVYDEIRRVGRLERWGHGAEIPVFAEDDEIVVVLQGHVVMRRESTGEDVRLTRGDAFGRTPKGRVASATSEGPTRHHELGAIRETTISTIDRDRLREVWGGGRATKSGEIGGWFRKRDVEVPVWPLVGSMPTTRIARVLVHLVEQYGQLDGERGRLPQTLKTGQIAQLAGLDEQRASRVWELFERTGLVGGERGAVVLEDMPALRKYALG